MIRLGEYPCLERMHGSPVGPVRKCCPALHSG